MRSLRGYSALPIGAIALVGVGSLLVPLIPKPSLAQTTDAAPVATEGNRSSISQPAASASDAGSQEAALKQAEDDLLKKLSASLPTTSDEISSEPAATIIVADAPTTAPSASTPGAVLSERIGKSPEAAAVTAATTSTTAASQTQPAVAPLAVCPPCAVQPTAAKPAKRPAGSSKSSGRASASSGVAKRDEFSFHGRSGACSDSIDDPYVPTSKQARVVASRAHLRIAPGRSESSLFVMPRNAIVSIEVRDGQWYRVTTASGIRGWLATQDVIFDVDVPESSTVAVGPYNGSYEPTGIKF